MHVPADAESLASTESDKPCDTSTPSEQAAFTYRSHMISSRACRFSWGRHAAALGLDPLPSTMRRRAEQPAHRALRVQRSFLHGTHRQTLEDEGRKTCSSVSVKRKGDVISGRRGPRSSRRDASASRSDSRQSYDTCEYTRFRAEANRILIKAKAGIESRPLGQTGGIRKRRNQRRAEAVNASRPPANGRVDQAIEPSTVRTTIRAITLSLIIAEAPRVPNPSGSCVLAMLSGRGCARSPAILMRLCSLGERRYPPYEAALHRDVEYQAHPCNERQNLLPPWAASVRR